MKQQIQKLIASNQLDQAKQLLVSACKKYPEDSDYWLLLSSVHGRLGNFTESMDCSRKTLALSPGNLEAHANLANALVASGDYAAAIEPYSEIVRLRPTDPVAFNNLGSAYAAAEKFSKAAHYFKKALEYQADYPEAKMNLAAAYRRSQNLELSAQTYREILDQYPNQLQPAYQLANTLVELGDLDSAVTVYKSIILNHPGFRKAIAGLVDAYERLGLYDEAIELAEEAVAQGDREPRLILGFAKLAKRHRKEKQAMELIRQLPQSAVSRSLRSKLQYQLAKLYESGTDYPNAFEHYRRANESQGYSYDAGNHSRLISAIIDIFSPDFFRSACTASNNSERPIFIVGMPRSGTSLTEQILCSHPLVSGAGELPTVTKLVWDLPRLTGTDATYPECARNISQQTIDSISEIYLDVIHNLFPEAEKVTDKLPHNFIYLGLIYLMFPNARFIHCERNAADTCLSIFCNHMTAAHGYSTTLANIGSHYSEYRRLMHHWEHALPARIHTVRYEHLLSEPEQQIRSLLDFCRLPWNSQCLEFHKSRRYVKTLSYEQVRNPLHTKSVGKWKAYKKFLSPLLDQLPEECLQATAEPAPSQGTREGVSQ